MKRVAGDHIHTVIDLYGINRTICALPDVKKLIQGTIIIKNGNIVHLVTLYLRKGAANYDSCL